MLSNAQKYKTNYILIGDRYEIEFVAGFNTLSEEEQDLYDKAYISRDIRNQCFTWSAIMLIGAVLSYFVTPYMAILAYIVWLVLFFKDVHWDNHKAFEKYLLK